MLSEVFCTWYVCHIYILRVQYSYIWSILCTSIYGCHTWDFVFCILYEYAITSTRYTGAVFVNDMYDYFSLPVPPEDFPVTLLLPGAQKCFGIAPPCLASSLTSCFATRAPIPRLQGSNASGYSAAQGYDPRRNVLSLGCRVAGPQAKSELLSVQGVACTFPNTTVNVIRSPPWELLLSRIGDDLMFLLLRQHAVLQRLPNRCYMQARSVTHLIV